MFAAKPHRLLVPFDGSFDARNASTEPPKPKEDWKERLEDQVKAWLTRSTGCSRTGALRS